MFINSQQNVYIVALIEHLSTSVVCVNLHYAVSAYENVDRCQQFSRTGLNKCECCT